MKRPVLPLALALAAATPALAQPPSAEAPARPGARAEVLVLGVYHMANPGRDIFNMKADDVLAPKRQAEIAQLVEVLRRFLPTKVAPFQRVVNYAKASGRSKELDDLMSESGAMVKAQGEYLASPATGRAPTSSPTGSAETCGSTATSRGSGSASSPIS